MLKRPWVVFLSALALALAGAPRLTAQSTATATPVRTLTGQVINGLTGDPVPRALVTIGIRNVLTDPRGRFEFAQFADARASARVLKPGFTGSLDPSSQMNGVQIADLDAPIVLKIYPDGIIRGTITDQDGLPLGRVGVSLMKATYDQHGLHETQAAFAQTDSHGQYRFREPPAKYRVVLRYVARLAETGEAALPVHVPDASAREDVGYFPLAPAEERVVDLHPHVSPTYTVTLRTDLEEGRFGMQLTAIGPGGEVFPLVAMPSKPGQYRISLPSGSYQIHILVNQADAMLEGSSRVTIAGHDVPEVAIHLTPAASLPIEVVVDQAASGAYQTAYPQQVTAQNLGLFLHPLSDQVEGQMNEIQPWAKGDGRFEFRVPAGRYRLRQNPSFLHVTSATCGGVNAITDEIAIAPGASGSVLRVSAVNDTAQVSGTIVPTPDPTAVSNGVSPGWIYLIPQFPTLSQGYPIRIQASGKWSSRVYPGTYAAVAVRDSIQADLGDPAVAIRYTRLGKTIDVAEAGTGSVELTLVTQVEGAP
jgi:hypothetical protein